MVIVFRGDGNHSNRLFQAIHIEAFCLENNIQYANPSLNNIEKYYGITGRSPYTYSCTVLKLLADLKLLRTLNCNAPEQYESYCALIRSNTLIFAQGWSFRVNHLTAKYRDYFVGKYSLLPKYYSNNPLYHKIDAFDRNAITVVGVHIRRGDYKTWEHGKYYFTDDVYENYMESLTTELKKCSSKKTVFIIFSNEKVAIQEAENIIVSNNAWYVDHFLMSTCDYLIGPPSTFTLWGSYIGDVKYFHITDAAGRLSLQDFSKCLG